MRRSSAVLVVGFSVALALLFLSSGGAHAKPQEWTSLCNHVVQPGETIWCIARGYGVSPWAVAAQNGVLNPNRIRPGMVLSIPDAPATLPAGPTCVPQCTNEEPSSDCTCASYHTVALGSNLYRISLLYGVGMWEIADCNDIFNLNRIRAGQVLCIPE
jgi:LysM repeat protein